MGCASGDGVPRAVVRNELDKCIVEAAWYDAEKDKPWGRGYGWYDAIATNGQTAARETVEGEGYAYAVVTPAGDCYQAARAPGGVMWKTREPAQMQAGKTTVIVFSEQTAEPAEMANEVCRFCRLGCCKHSVQSDEP
jgi:hypothetical protein